MPSVPAKTGSGKGIMRREFIMHDGEAVRLGFICDSKGVITPDISYCLLGNSKGHELLAKRLSTKEMFDFLLDMGEKYPKDFHVGFVFDYDVNNILKDLTKACLIMLKERNRCQWEGYTIVHYPRKSFSIRYETRHVRIDDCWTFFRSAYCTGDRDNPGALDKYNIGTPAARAFIASGKSRRTDFTWADMESVVQYQRAELSLGPPLMEAIRKCCDAAGIHLTRWYGTGALAKYELGKRHASRHLCKTPDYLLLPVRYAYGGGWFERFKAGAFIPDDYTIPCVWTADLNSAYAFAMSLLPSLANGEWRLVEGDRARDYARSKRFGVYNIRFGYGHDNTNARNFNDFARSSHGMPLPLFQRNDKGNITHPVRCESWYWDPEAFAVSRDPSTVFLRAWIFDDNGELPFDWVEDVYNLRLQMQQADPPDPAEKALKWLLACLYGTFAQRQGWNRRTRTPPRYHQLEYAGWITSLCRMKMFSAMRNVALAGGLVSVDTDGFISTVRPEEKDLTGGVGNGLGQWKIEQFSGIIYFQNGIYWLRDLQGNWQPPKTRGIPRSQIGNPGSALDSLGRDGKFSVTQHHLVGYGAALARNRLDLWNTWEDIPHEINVESVGSRQHVHSFCRSCKKGLRLSESLHDLSLSLPGTTEREIAQPHFLPWLADSDDDALRERLRHAVEEHYVNEVFG